MAIGKEGTVTALDACERTLALVDGIIAGIEPGQLDAPTPCDEWTVRTVITHLAQTNRQYAAIAAGQPFGDRGPDPTTSDEVGDDPLAVFRASSDELLTVFRRPGLPERLYDFPWGTEPGASIIRHVANELLIHGWDLASATGQSTDFPRDLVAASRAVWEEWFARFPRDAGNNFGPEQTAPAGATDADRLAAYLGRVV